MDQNLLVVEQIKAGRQLLDCVEEQIPVAAAAWVLREGALEWRLYIVTKELSHAASRDFDSVLRDVLAAQPSLWIAPHQVLLVGSEHPAGRDAIKMKSRDPGSALIRFDGGVFGNAGVEQAFIYGVSLTPQAVA